MSTLNFVPCTNIFNPIKCLHVLLNRLEKVNGIVHPKMKITHYQAMLGLYDFLLSDEYNLSYIKNVLALLNRQKK